METRVEELLSIMNNDNHGKIKIPHRLSTSNPGVSAFWFTVCNVLYKLVAIVSIPIFTRMMSTDDFGLTTLYTSWQGVLIIVFSLNLYGGVFNNGMHKYADNRQQFLSSVQGLSTITSGIGLMLALIFRNFLSDIMGIPVSLVILLFVSFMFLPSFEYWSAKTRFEYNYKPLLLATVIYSALMILVPCYFVSQSTDKGITKAVSNALVGIGFSAFFYVCNLMKGKSFINKEYWHYVFRFNLPLIPHYLAAILLVQSDRIVVARMVGQSEAGIYGVASSIGSALTIAVTAINSAYVPWLYRNIDENAFAKIRKTGNQIVLLVGGLFFLLVTCSPEILFLFASKDYADALYLIAPLALGSWFSVLYLLFGNVEIFFEKRVFMSITSVLVAVLNIVLNIIAIPHFGYAACAYTTALCYLLYGLAHFSFMLRIRKGEKSMWELKIYGIGRIAAIYSAISIVAVIQMTLYRHTLVRYLVLLLVLLLSFIFFRKRHTICDTKGDV